MFVQDKEEKPRNGIRAMDRTPICKTGIMDFVDVYSYNVVAVAVAALVVAAVVVARYWTVGEVAVVGPDTAVVVVGIVVVEQAFVVELVFVVALWSEVEGGEGRSLSDGDQGLQYFL